MGLHELQASAPMLNDMVDATGIRWKCGLCHPGYVLGEVEQCNDRVGGPAELHDIKFL